jgi:actin-related protein
MTSKAIVIDHGTSTCKVGFSGDSLPNSIVPSVLGRPKMKFIKLGKDVFIGNEAISKRGVLTLKYPIQKGLITNFQDMELLWDHIFQTELNISPKEFPVLLTETVQNSKENKEKMTQIMFEKFSTPSLNISSRSVLSLFSSGRLTGVALESGDSVTSSVPICEGKVLKDAIESTEIAGGELTDFLMEILGSRGYGFGTMAEREIARDLKEKFCYVAVDYEEDWNASQLSSEIERNYELPDDSSIIVANERFKCPELLFQPSFKGMDCLGIHESCLKSIQSCHEGIRKELFSNIVLSGGNTLFEGFSERITKEISKSVDSVKVISPKVFKNFLNFRNESFVLGLVVQCFQKIKNLGFLNKNIKKMVLPLSTKNVSDNKFFDKFRLDKWIRKKNKTLPSKKLKKFVFQLLQISNRMIFHL